MVQFITEAPDQPGALATLPAPNEKLLASLQSSRGDVRFASNRRYQSRTKLPSIRVQHNEPAALSPVAREPSFIGSSSKERDIDAMLSKKLESLPHMQIKDEIKRMIPVRGMGIIDRKLKEFISKPGDSPRKAIPQQL